MKSLIINNTIEKNAVKDCSLEELKSIIISVLEREEELRRTLEMILTNITDENITSIDFNKIRYYNLQNND